MQPQKYWREIPRRYRLEAAKCSKCGKLFFPPRLVCDGCKTREFSTVRLSDAGKVYSWTVIRSGPSGFAAQTPYVLAVVELEEGVRLTMQIADCAPDEVSIGARVKVEFRKINEVGRSGVICYGYKAVLALGT